VAIIFSSRLILLHGQIHMGVQSLSSTHTKMIINWISRFGTGGFTLMHLSETRWWTSLL